MPPAVSSPFAAFAATADAIAATTSKLAKRDLLAAYLRDLPAADVPIAATFFAGRPLPGAADKLGLGWVQLSDAVARASGAGDRELSRAYLRHSDVGDAALELLERRASQVPSLTMAEVDRAFSEATLALFPYRPELDQSGALLQALGAGVPAIAYDVGGIAEPVRRYGAGRVVPPGDVESLADAIRELLDDRERRPRWRARIGCGRPLCISDGPSASCSLRRSLMPQRWSGAWGRRPGLRTSTTAFAASCTSVQEPEARGCSAAT